jgi:hypothetical protein
MNSWYHLNIEHQALNADWTYPTVSVDTPRKIWIYKPGEILNESWIDLFNTYELDPINVLVFYCNGYWTTEYAHIDGDKPSDPTFALNWVTHGLDSEMLWYNLPERVGITEHNLLPEHYNYSKWRHDTLTRLDQCEIGTGPTIVRIDIPHRISVRGHPRWSFSVRFKTKIHHWEDLVQHARNHNILIERE